MTKSETLAQITLIEAQIKDLTAQRDELRIDAVTNGWAMWETTIRWNAPNLAWWKEHKPKAWQSYATQSTVKKFKVNA